MPIKGSKQRYSVSGSIIDETTHFNLESQDAEKEYYSAINKRKGRTSLGIVAIIILELGIGGALITQIKAGGYLERFVKEIQIQKTGEIAFETGKYSGETDLGIIRGVGEFDFDTGTIYSGE